MSEKRISDEDLAYFRRDMSAMDGEHVDLLLDEVIALRAAALTSEEVASLRLIPGVLETVFNRAMIESAVNGTPPPVRDHIDRTISALDRVLAAAEVKS